MHGRTPQKAIFLKMMDKGFSYSDIKEMLPSDVHEYLSIMEYQDDLARQEIENMKGKT